MDSKPNIHLLASQLGCLKHETTTKNDQLAEEENGCNTLPWCTLKEEPLDIIPSTETDCTIQCNLKCIPLIGELKTENHFATQKPTMYGCKICGRIYRSMNPLRQHLRSHAYKMAFTCHFCWKVFSRRWSLKNHFRVHTGERPYNCPHCLRAFADRSNLRAHLDIHSDVRKYVCIKCNKSYTRIALWKQHNEMAH